MHFIDTHTHLFVNEFDNDRTEVVHKALNAGIKKMILPGINSTYNSVQKEMTERFPENCFAASGLHPSDVKEDFEEELQQVELNLETGAYIAVGEIGIDLYWDKTFKKEQQLAFEKQINLAKEYKLPVIIHVRDSFDEIFEITDAANDENLKGIFHSFTGTTKQAEKIIAYGGFKIGINGIVTFKNSGLDKIVKEIDIEHLVLETDSPYLSPVPKRGKRNESSHLVYIAEKISKIKNISSEVLAEASNSNAIEIFGKKIIISKN